MFQKIDLSRFFMMRTTFTSYQRQVELRLLRCSVGMLIPLLLAVSPVRAYQPDTGHEDREATLDAVASSDEDHESRVALSSAVDVGHLRSADPKRYAAWREASLREGEKVLFNNEAPEPGLNNPLDAVDGYVRLAEYVRFTLADPKRAVDLYERAIALSESIPRRWALPERLGIADTLRFDLKDTEQARVHYRKALEQAPQDSTGNEFDHLIARTVPVWLRAELDYLETGKPFEGVPDRYAIAGMMLALRYSAPVMNNEDVPLSAMCEKLRYAFPQDNEREGYARMLEALPTSQGRVLSLFDFLPLLGSSERVANFMRRHDPAGFITASLFGAWHLTEEAHRMDKSEEVPPGMNVLTWREHDRLVMQEAETAMFGRKIVIVKPDEKEKNGAVSN